MNLKSFRRLYIVLYLIPNKIDVCVQRIQPRSKMLITTCIYKYSLNLHIRFILDFCIEKMCKSKSQLKHILFISFMK